jgi:hypothetical protein
LWARWWSWTKGEIPTCNYFTEAQAQHAWERAQTESNLMENVQTAPDPPPKFKSFQNWRIFSEGVSGYLSNIRGVIHLPLSYLIHGKDTYSDDEMDAFYATNPTEEEILLRTVIIAGYKVSKAVKEDNHRLWYALRNLVENTDGWNTIQPF